MSISIINSFSLHAGAMDIEAIIGKRKDTKEKAQTNIDKSELRKRDPIGRILDNLCNPTKSKEEGILGKKKDEINDETSAFRPFSKSSEIPLIPPFDKLQENEMEIKSVCVNKFLPTTSMHGDISGFGNRHPLPQPHFPIMPFSSGHPVPFRQQFPIATPHSGFVPPGAVPFLASNIYENKFPSITGHFPNCFFPQYFPEANFRGNIDLPLKQSAPIGHPDFFMRSEKSQYMSSSPPRYQCENCKKSYSTYGGLSKHKQFHCTTQVKREFSCKYCGKCYGSLGALKMHIRTHTLPCKCKLCGKAFSRPWLLQGHMRTHTGEKPFSCLHCARAFADRSNLRAHLQTHSDVKKYGCKTCSKTFSRMSLLVKHRENNNCGVRTWCICTDICFNIFS